jgi:hypothetical protein
MAKTRSFVGLEIAFPKHSSPLEMLNLWLYITLSYYKPKTINNCSILGKWEILSVGAWIKK